MAGKSVMPLFYESGATVRTPAPRTALARAKALVPSASTAVLRVPERPSAQLAYLFPAGAPQIFVHEGARQVARAPPERGPPRPGRPCRSRTTAIR